MSRMKMTDDESQFATVQVAAARRQTTPELYPVFADHKNGFSSLPKLRSYAPKTGLYLDATGTYTFHFSPRKPSRVTLKLWYPQHELRIDSPRRGHVNETHPGKAE